MDILSNFDLYYHRTNPYYELIKDYGKFELYIYHTGNFNSNNVEATYQECFYKGQKKECMLERRN